MELRINPQQLSIQVNDGDNLLDVLRSSNVSISYSCVSGRCGLCKCKLMRGSVSDLRLSVSARVSSQEILACQTVLVEDSEIELPDSDDIVVFPAKALQAKMTSVELVSSDIVVIRLNPGKEFNFAPGQFANLQFAPGYERPYSMAGLDSDSELEFHIRVVPDGRVTQYVKDHLSVGNSVRVSGPLGTAYLRAQRTGPILCVAGGTGLAPVISIVRGALAAGHVAPIHLYVAANRKEDIYGSTTIEALSKQYPNLRISYVVMQETRDPTVRHGLVTDAISEDIVDAHEWNAYICGSPAMVEAVASRARNIGIPDDKVYAGAFYFSNAKDAY